MAEKTPSAASRGVAGHQEKRRHRAVQELGFDATKQEVEGYDVGQTGYLALVRCAGEGSLDELPDNIRCSTGLLSAPSLASSSRSLRPPFEIEVGKDTTVRQLMEKVATLQPVPADFQRIVWRGRYILPTERLSSYGVLLDDKGSGVNLLMVPKLTEELRVGTVPNHNAKILYPGKTEGQQPLSEKPKKLKGWQERVSGCRGRGMIAPRGLLMLPGSRKPWAPSLRTSLQRSDVEEFWDNRKDLSAMDKKTSVMSSWS